MPLNTDRENSCSTVFTKYFADSLDRVIFRQKESSFYKYINKIYFMYNTLGNNRKIAY